MTRSDIHRPGKLIPENYTFIGSFFRFRIERDSPEGKTYTDWAEEGTAPYYEAQSTNALADIHPGAFRCDICGAWYHSGGFFRHVTTGELITAGYDCAGKVLRFHDFEAEAKRCLAARQAAETKKRRRMNLRQFVASTPVDLRRALRADHSIIQDIRRKLIRRTEWFIQCDAQGDLIIALSDKQAALVLKLAGEVAERAVEQAEERHVAVPVDGERIDIEGVVVSAKWRENNYGEALKLTVKIDTPAGSWLAWGTAPRALYDTQEYDDSNGLRGARVSFTAMVTPGGTDQHFGFYSRPTNACVLEWPEEAIAS